MNEDQTSTDEYVREHEHRPPEELWDPVEGLMMEHPKQARPKTVAPRMADPNRLKKELRSAMDERAALLAKRDEMRELVEELRADLEETRADNEIMMRAFDANPQVKEAMAEVAFYRKQIAQTQRILVARAPAFNNRLHELLHWKNRANKAEKKLEKLS